MGSKFQVKCNVVGGFWDPCHVADVTEVQLTVSDVITIFIKASSEPGDSRKKTRLPLLFQAALIEKKKVQIEAGI